MKYPINEAWKNGIFIQQNDSKPNKYCVTFPNMGNEKPIFPSEYFPTYQKALNFALNYKKCDSRIKNLPLYVNQCLWRGCSGKRIYILISAN